MLRADTSPVKARRAEIGKTMPQNVFSGCNDTLQALQTAEGKSCADGRGAHRAGGIVRRMELQEAGWSYLRP